MVFDIRIWWLLSACIAGCSFPTTREIFPDVVARQAPSVRLGAESILLDNDAVSSTGLVSSDGSIHVFAADEERKFYHLEINRDGVVRREILGKLDNSAEEVAIDAVEQAAGTLRVLIGDRQYLRSRPDAPWREIRENRCVRFLVAGERLFCGFKISGAEIEAPKRKDVSVGLFVVLPIVYWSNMQAEKLVLAQEIDGQWMIRAVFDADTILDADNDFVLQTDVRGVVHALYYNSRGGTVWAAVGGPGGAMGGASGFKPELRHASLLLDQLPPVNIATNTAVDPKNTSHWISVHGADLPELRVSNTPFPYQGWLRPLNRHFAIDASSGAMIGITDVSEETDAGIVDQVIRVSALGPSWFPVPEIIAVGRIPDDRFAHYSLDLIRIDDEGGNHVLAMGCSMWGGTCFKTYFRRAANRWSAPLILGPAQGGASSLAVGRSGAVFAAWTDDRGRFVGRWIDGRQ